ncbi:MAG: ankyrin repeat domain-containing protein [Bacteriovoracia bacterium]
MSLSEWVYKPNKYEKKLMEEDSRLANIAIDCAILAQAAMTILYLTPFQQHNNGDAFRHCFWSALISNRTNPDWALLWTTAHEEILPTENITRIMDLKNNAAGIQIFKENLKSKESDLIYYCLEKIKNGELSRIENGTIVPTNTIGFNIPSIFFAISQRADVIVSYLSSYHFDSINEIDGDMNSALHRCILDNYEEGFKILLDVIDVNRRGSSDLTPLMVSAGCPHGVEYAQALLNRGANPNLQEKFYLETALIIAASSGDKRMVELLIPFSDKSIKSKNGFNAYDKAMNEGHLEIAKLLL